jgi:MIP family channel proteins
MVLDIAVSSMAEYLGMAVFVLIGCGAAVTSGIGDPILSSARITLISLAFGFTLMAMIFSIAKVSGAHLNPAVTLALVITRNCGVLRGLCYIISQMVGAITGAALLDAIVPDSYQGVLGANSVFDPFNQGEAFIAEMLGTAALCYTVMQCAYLSTDPNARRYNMGNQAPLAIGLVVAAVHLFMIPIDGTSINSARSFGPSVVADFWDDHWYVKQRKKKERKKKRKKESVLRSKSTNTR